MRKLFFSVYFMTSAHLSKENIHFESISPMKRCFSLLLLLLAIGTFAGTGWDYELSDGVKLHLGLDERIRYESYSRSTLNVDGGMKGPAIQYYRFRTRAWGALNIGEDLTLNLRMVNRSQWFTSHRGDPNNIHRGGSTWDFPDETTLDLANVKWRNLGGVEGLSATLGRQGFSFGNGMIFSEGTPFDQARTSYWDGLRLRYKDDADDASLLVLYNTWKDHWPRINDRNRRLLSGDVFTSAAYWTHQVNDAFKFDLYYVYDDIDDDFPNEKETCYAADMNYSLHTVGGRLFGKPASFLEYSVEGAMQFGRNPDGRANQGKMADARLRFLLPEEWLKSSVGLAYTHFSGDHRNTGKNEGWVPLWSACPLWGENLFPVLLNSYWSNLNFYQADFTFAPIAKMEVKLRTAAVYAVHDNAVDGPSLKGSTGGGSYIGWLNSLFVGYRLNEHLSFWGEYTCLKAGNYYRNGRNPHWIQLQVLYNF